MSGYFFKFIFPYNRINTSKIALEYRIRNEKLNSYTILETYSIREEKREREREKKQFELIFRVKKSRRIRRLWASMLYKQSVSNEWFGKLSVRNDKPLQSENDSDRCSGKPCFKLNILIISDRNINYNTVRVFNEFLIRTEINLG